MKVTREPRKPVYIQRPVLENEFHFNIR